MHTCITGDVRKMFYDVPRIPYHTRQFDIVELTTGNDRHYP